MIINSNTSINLLVTPFQNKNLPIYNWYNFRHAFSKDLVVNLFDNFKLKKGDKVLDPFCGGGTTLLAAREKDIYSRGIDILPSSILISNSKLINYSKEKINKNINEIDNILNKNFQTNIIDSENINMLRKYFSHKNFHMLKIVVEWLENKNDKEIKYFFLTALFSILEDISYAKKDGGFIRIVKKRKSNLKEKYICQLLNMSKDIDIIKNLPKVKNLAIKGDARQIRYTNEYFTSIITSPPYPNRHDYTRVYLLELLIGFVKNNSQIKRLRYNALRSHVEAKEQFIDKKYKESSNLTNILNKLKHKELPNNKVIDMLSGYFKDLHIAIREFKRVVKKKGNIAFVLGNARYGGVEIPVNDIIIEICKNHKLEFVEKIIARYRGNSPQQMEVYGKKDSEESILIFQK